LSECCEVAACCGACVFNDTATAEIYTAFGDLAASLDAARTALSVAERLPEAGGERESWAAFAHYRVGLVLKDQGDYPGALVEFRAEFDIMQRLIDQASDNA
jgi:hypothetical protein